MELQLSSPDLNLIRNLWTVVKIKLYKCGKQYDSIAET